MGQYHTIYNKTKKEYLRIGGAKLWEQAHDATAAGLLLLLSNSNGRGGGDFNTYPESYDDPTDQDRLDKAIIQLVAGRWAGDQLVVQGDYADKKDLAYIKPDEFDDFTNISTLVEDALLIADNGNNSEMLKIIEAERKYKPSATTRVHKVKALDRNKRQVELYRADFSIPKPLKRKTKGVQK